MIMRSNEGYQEEMIKNNQGNDIKMIRNVVLGNH